MKIALFKQVQASWMGMTLFVAGCHRGAAGSDGGAPTPVAEGPVRPPAVADQFYPAAPTKLSNEVDRCLASASVPAMKGQVVAVLVPHAGYYFSAAVAAYSYKAIAPQKVTDVVLIGNTHHFPLQKGAMYAVGSFETPFGKVPVNAQLAQAILKESRFLEANPRIHGPEHSLEVQLPFLQRIHPNVRIVPILLGGNFPLSVCQDIGEGIARGIKASGLAETAVIVNSSDMPHYPSGADANRVDREALKAFETFDPEVLARKIQTSMEAGYRNLQCVFCGEESVYATQYAARELGADSIQVLHYAHPGDVSGDQGRVVGYGAAAYLKGAGGRKKAAIRAEPVKKEDPVQKPFEVSASNQTFLLKVARDSIAYYLEKGRKKTFESSDPELMTPAAVFVTLTQGGQLRGCIGILEPRASLLETVAEFAVAAAVEDNRFPPVTRKELDGLRIEISVLSPMVKVANAEAIQPNVHGVVVQRGMRRGLFLPQVWEHFSRKEDFLGELCHQKAHLDPDAWKDPKTDLYIFTVFAFEEPHG